MQHRRITYLLGQRRARGQNSASCSRTLRQAPRRAGGCGGSRRRGGRLGRHTARREGHVTETQHTPCRDTRVLPGSPRKDHTAVTHDHHFQHHPETETTGPKPPRGGRQAGLSAGRRGREDRGPERRFSPQGRRGVRADSPPPVRHLKTRLHRWPVTPATGSLGGTVEQGLHTAPVRCQSQRSR